MWDGDVSDNGVDMFCRTNRDWCQGRGRMAWIDEVLTFCGRRQGCRSRGQVQSVLLRRWERKREGGGGKGKRMEVGAKAWEGSGNETRLLGVRIRDE